jgi:hypothetical protein
MLSVWAKTAGFQGGLKRAFLGKVPFPPGVENIVHFLQKMGIKMGVFEVRPKN